jgi:hypothetical protein
MIEKMRDCSGAIPHLLIFLFNFTVKSQGTVHEDLFYNFPMEMGFMNPS